MHTPHIDGDPPAKLNTDLLKKSIAAFQEVSKRYSDANFFTMCK